jgi:hypothetical protein
MNKIPDDLLTITREQALKDYKKLIAVSKFTPAQRVGNKAVDCFSLGQRLATKMGSSPSFLDWLKTDECEKPYYAKLIKHKIETGDSINKAKLGAWRLYSHSGACSSFKPVVAKQVYLKYKPRAVLDFSAGWGGRCVAAMAMGIDYIGIDTNVALQPAYDGFVETFPSKSKVSMIWENSAEVDYSALPKYDLIFTSPPYWTTSKPTEQYENMPEYASRDEFYEKWFFPVVDASFEHLAHGGNMILNLPLKQYEALAAHFRPADSQFPLLLQKRKSNSSYEEFLYVWNKPECEGLAPSTFSHRLLKTKASLIHGFGLFAKQDIKAGVKIYKYEGESVPYADFKEMYGTDWRYCLKNRNYPVIVAKNMPYLTGNPCNYLNESDDPNVCIKRHFLIALRDIDAGEELTLKYHVGYQRDWK